MPLVFVHGVANRISEKYNESLCLRDSYFRQYVISALCRDPESVHIFNPYWGQYGAVLHWGGASLTIGENEDFGPTDELDLLTSAILPITASEDTPLLNLARESLIEAVDLLWAAAGLTQPTTDVAKELAYESAHALAYAENNPHPDWLIAVDSDRDFIVRLSEEVTGGRHESTHESNSEEEEEEFGLDDIWSRVQGAGSRIRGSAANYAGAKVSDRVRGTHAPQAAIFLGDVFTYIQQTQLGDSSEIAKIVLNDLRAAAELKRPGDPLIVVGHSMGGNIAYDLLTSIAQNLEVDLFVTVGSQVGLFEELKLFKASDMRIPGASTKKVPKPKNIKRWLNVFDRNDMLGFSVAPVIEGVTDHPYATDSLLSAHSAYLLQPRFHLRLAKRAEEPS